MTTSPTENPCTEILKTDASGRVRLPREKQEALLAAFEKSGMSGQSFAAWAGEKDRTLASWRQKLRKARAEGSARRLPRRWDGPRRWSRCESGLAMG